MAVTLSVPAIHGPRTHRRNLPLENPYRLLNSIASNLFGYVAYHVRPDPDQDELFDLSNKARTAGLLAWRLASVAGIPFEAADAELFRARDLINRAWLVLSRRSSECRFSLGGALEDFLIDNRLDDLAAFTDIGWGANLDAICNCTNMLPLDLTSRHNQVPPHRRARRKDINAQMLGVLTKTPEARTWPASRWAKHLSCSEGTVKGTRTWSNLMKARALDKADATDRLRQAHARY